MKKLYFLLLAALCCFKANAQTAAATSNPAPAKGNYLLAARFSPKKIGKMVFSTSVDPHWLKLSNRFWYSYESGEGSKWYIVDPALKPRNRCLITPNWLLLLR
jgi:dipeptidyl-peptidase-4